MAKGKFADITGQRFGRLTVVGKAPYHITKSGYRVTMWNCICDCGESCVVQLSALRSGAVKSCGCYKIEVNRKQAISMCEERAKTAGMHSREKLYSIWNGMIQRCYNEKQKSFKRYGGRGITVCDEWKKDYTKFKEWAVENGFERGLTLDRIDVNGPYAPWNCRWITVKQQNNNKRNNRIVEMNGESHTISEWSTLLKVTYRKVWYHVNRGLTGDDLYHKIIS